MALNPDWVRMDYLTPDHDPDRVTLPQTPRTARQSHDPKNPLYAIYGQDPRKKSVEQIVTRLAKKVQNALSGVDR